MQAVRVYNDNVHPLVEIFKGNTIQIGAKDYWRNEKGEIKEMDIYEASEFKGQYHPVPIDTNGMLLRDDPRYFKKIKIEVVQKELPKTEPKFAGMKCMVPGCGHTSPSPEELEAHNTVRHPEQKVAEGTLEGPLTPSMSPTRPIFQQNTASPGKEGAPSVKKAKE